MKMDVAKAENTKCWHRKLQQLQLAACVVTTWNVKPMCCVCFVILIGSKSVRCTQWLLYKLTLPLEKASCINDNDTEFAYYYTEAFYTISNVKMHRSCTKSHPAQSCKAFQIQIKILSGVSESDSYPKIKPYKINWKGKLATKKMTAWIMAVDTFIKTFFGGLSNSRISQ